MTKTLTNSSLHLNETRAEVYGGGREPYALYRLHRDDDDVYQLVEGSYEEVTEHLNKVFDMNVKMFQADVERLKTQYVIIDRSKREVIYGNNEYYPEGSRY